MRSNLESHMSDICTATIFCLQAKTSVPHISEKLSTPSLQKRRDHMKATKNTSFVQNKKATSKKNKHIYPCHGGGKNTDFRPKQQYRI